MSERASYTPGTPCWVELSTPDNEAAESFYGDLLGWEIPEMASSAELGGYRRAKKDGKDVAGVAPLQQEGQPPSWNTYVSVADARAALAAAAEAGGTVIVEALDVRNLGTMGVFTDPTGAVCGVWQPGTFAGAQLVNEYGTFGWNELNTRDVGAAKAFYGALFGWGFEDQDMGDMGTYSVLKAGDASRGGMLDITGRVPDEVPSHWLVYFSVEDSEAALETVKGGGGEVRFGPIDIPVGRFAVVSDPAGAVFALMQPTQETLESAP